MNHHRRKRSFFSFSLSSSSLAYRSLFAHRFETREASLIIARTSFNHDTPRSRKRIENSKPQGWYCRLEKEKSRSFFLEKFILFSSLLLCKDKILGRKKLRGRKRESFEVKGKFQRDERRYRWPLWKPHTTRNTRRRKHLAEDITYGGNRALGR